jgi:hypothetical protein
LLSSGIKNIKARAAKLKLSFFDFQLFTNKTAQGRILVDGLLAQTWLYSNYARTPIFWYL